MTQQTDTTSPTRAFWLVGALALVWNAIGIVTYLQTVTISEEALAAMAEAERSLYESTPAWATSAYAIAVFSGTLGSLALLLRKAWALPVLVLSLAGILVQMGQAFFMSEMVSVLGAGATVLPLLIIGVAVYLVWFSKSAKAKGWIR